MWVIRDNIGFIQEKIIRHGQQDNFEERKYVYLYVCCSKINVRHKVTAAAGTVIFKLRVGPFLTRPAQSLQVHGLNYANEYHELF